MKNFLLIVLALLVSLLVHYLTFDTLNNQLSKKKLQYPTTNKKTSQKKGYNSIKYVKLIPKQTQKKIKKPKKNIVKKELKKIEKKLKPTKNKAIKKIAIAKKTKQLDLKQLFTKKEKELEKNQQTKEKEIKEKKIQDEKKSVKKLDKMTQQYIKLYGEKYYNFSDKQKQYIKNNISTIGKITQKYLKYPRISVRTKQSGTNIIEFKLHPNGDITNLKLIGSSNYTALDQNTINTIKIAYADYPKPSEPTWIKIFVNYVLY